MEAMGPPFYRSYFGWGKKEIGLVFMGVAICAILGYSFMKFVSQQIETPGTGYRNPHKISAKQIEFGDSRYSMSQNIRCVD